MHNTKAKKKNPKTRRQTAEKRQISSEWRRMFSGNTKQQLQRRTTTRPPNPQHPKNFFFFFFFFNASFNFLTLPSMTIHTTWLIFPGNTEKIERNHWAGRNGLPSYKQSFGAMNSFTYLGVFIKDIYEC
jgi:hypothetical protein